MVIVSETKKQVLVVSSDPRALAAVKKSLMHDFAVRIATAEGALPLLQTYDADAIIVYVRPDTDLPSFKDIAGRAKQKQIPLLFLAESDRESDEAAAFAIGAADYVLKRQSADDALISRLHLRIRTYESLRLLARADNPPGVTGVPTAETNRSAGAPNPAVLARPAPQEQAAVSPEDAWAGKTVLVAEDVVINQEMIGIILSEIEGLELEFVCNGAEAVEQIRRCAERYALILMDIQMPEMDGLSATSAIRRQENKAAQRIPIIALTATATDDDIKEFTRVGMNGYLEKPLDYEKFLSCVKYL